MRVMGLAGRFVAVIGLAMGGLTACQWVADIEDIELTSGSSAASSSGAGTGGKPGASSSSSSSSASASSSASGAGGAMPGTVVYKATVADCVNTNSPNPDDCEADAGKGQMRVDTNSPYAAFLRFDLDGALAGRTVKAIKLILSTTTDSNAPSDKTGQIWRAAAFDRTALFSTVPAKMGGSPVADDLGAVGKSMICDWSLLPTTLVAANTPLYLRIEPTSGDAVRYWNTKGTTPPELVIDYQ